MAGLDQHTLWKLASMILGRGKSDVTVREQATFLRTDQDGTQWVVLPGSDDETPVNGRSLASAQPGDSVEWSIDDGRLSIIGNSTSPSVGRDYVGSEVSVVTKQVEAVRADVIETNELLATKATIGELEAESARIDDLEADHVSVSDFQAEQANIDSLQAATADIDTIRANSAKVQNLTAAQLEADHAKVGQLDADQIAADHATIGTLDTTYMHADMANASVAWIQNGTIKDGSIVSAMINDVSANKLTAGTINGSVINVTNLNADNITAGTINGQRIGEGSLSLDKLSEDVYTETEVDNIVEGLNDRIDGAIETHTGTTVPTLNNTPASAWNTTKLRDEHVGDVYYVVNSQSQQNGYCYRFTKSGSTYSWQLIKDSDVTAALSRLTTAEGKITTFDSDISTLKTTTGTLTTKTESLETRMSDAESDILDKVDTTTFNEVSDTVDSHSQTITQMTTTLSNKADSSTVTAVTNRVSKNEQDISGINTTIGELQDTVETKADGSTVSTISNRLNTVSDTVDGHTQTLTSVQETLETKADGSTVSALSTKVNNVSDTVDGHTSQLSSITSTQTTMQTTLDKTVKSSIQLWYSKANTTAPSKPTSKVTSTSTSGNAWRTVVPAYSSSYPHYYYCWQYEYVDGTYGWSAVVRDIAMGESQSTARTADSNASAAVTTANTASTNASTALTTANTANTNASEAKTTATTASTTASEAKTTAETASSDASTAKTNAASAVSTANSASTTATNAQTTANANIKSSVQLWFTKANSTAPNKPTSVVSTSNANTANAWNLVVPVWNKNYPHYFYCYQQQKGDGNYQWTDVVYDRATSEAQQLANTTSTNLSTLQTNYATFKQQTEQFESTVGTTYATKTELKGATDDITELENRVSTNETSISNNASAISLKANSSDVYTKSSVDGLISTEVTNRDAAITAKANEITSTVSQTYTTKEEFDNLEVGGRNLLLWSGDANHSPVTRWSTQNNVTSKSYDTTYDAFKYVTPADSGNQNNGMAIWTLNDGWTNSYGRSQIVNGSSYVFSIDVMGTLSSGNPMTMKVFYSSSTGDWNATPNPSVDVTDKVKSDSFTRVSLTFTLPSTRTEGTRIVLSLGAKGATFYVKNPKLELGNKATAWTPAPEDIETRVSSAESSISQNAENIELKVSKDGVISSINQSAESVKIDADRVEIDGAAVFSNSAFQEHLTSSYSKTIEYAYYNNGQGSGYAKLANITAKAAYLNLPITFTLYRRGQAAASHVTVAFANSSPTDTLSKAYYDGWLQLYYVRVGTGSYDIYIALGESWDTVKVADFVNPYPSSNMEVTWAGAYYGTSLPSGAVVFTRLIGQETKESYDNAIAAAQSTANAAAPKTSAVKRTQRIWYRKSASGAPATPGTASSNWVVKADDGDNAWTKMHVAISSSAKYIYTCEQYEMADGTVGYTSVLLDNTITVIDGGNIITGSVTANKLDASDINASKSLTVGAMTDAAASTILNSNVWVGGRNLLRRSYYQQTATADGITCTNNGDGSVTINGTTTATPTVYYFNDSSASSRGHVTLEAGTYTLSGCPDGGSDGTWRLDMYGIPTSSGTVAAVDYGDGVTFTTTGGTPTFIRMRFPSGITLNNFTVWPKLEHGNKATDWSPAPEDVDSAISNAAKTATSYVTDIDSNGITVHPSRSDYATNGGRAVINGDGLTVYLGSDDVASYGASARIGKMNSDRVTVDSTNGITIYKGNSKRLQTTANGIDVYGSDGTTSIASFGATARIGKSNGTRVVVDTSSVKIIPNNKTANALTFEADDDYAQILYGNNYLNVGGVLFGYADDLEADTIWVNQGLHVGGGSTAGNPKFQVNSNGQAFASYQLVATGEMNDIALRANSAGNRGLYDVANDQWILYRYITDDKLVLNIPLHDFTGTCTVNTTNATVYNNLNSCWHNRACCTITLAVKLKAALASGSTVDIATAPENFRPQSTVSGSVYVTGQSVDLQAQVYAGGLIRLNNRSGSSASTSAQIYVTFTFAL